MRCFSRLILLWLLGSAPLSYGQTYFNRRYQTPPNNAVYQLLSDGGTGWWMAGGCNIAAYPGRVVLSMSHVDEFGAPLGPARFYGALDADFYPGSGGNLLPWTQGRMILIAGRNDVTYGSRSVLWCFDAQGDTLWTRTYNDTTGAMITRAGVRLSDGGYALVGDISWPFTPTRAGYDVVLLRTDSLGHELWRRTYDQGYYDGAGAVIEMPGGDLLLSGSFLPFSSGPTEIRDILMLRVDAQGNEKRRTILGGPYVDAGGLLLPTPDGGYVMAGTWTDRLLGPPWAELSQSRPTLFWFDSSGTTLVRRRSYGPGGYVTISANFLALPDGGYLIGGQSSDTTNAPTLGSGHPDGFLLRVCADGDSVWYRQYRNLTGGYSHNYLRDVKLAPDGGYVGAGFLFPFAPDTGVQGAWLFKTDANGYLQAGGAPPGVVCPVVGLGGGANGAAAAGVEVWPNPAPDGRYRVRVGGQGAALAVYDAVGRVVWRGAIEGPEGVVDLNRHAPGVYHLQVQRRDGAVVMRRLLR